MGYIEGLVNTLFKKTERGRSIFFPYGILGSGYYVVQDEETKIQKFIALYYKVSFLTLIFVLMFFGLQALWLLLLDLPWYHFKIKRLLKSAERAQEKTTFLEQAKRMAIANGVLTNVLLLVISLLMVGASILYLVWSVGKGGDKGIGVLGAAFSGACLLFSIALVRYSVWNGVTVPRTKGTANP